MLRNLLLGMVIVSGLGLSQNANGNSKESAIRHMLSEQEQAWNRGDGVAWAKGFSDDADFINVRGDVFHGLSEIGARHSAILGGPFKGSHVSITIRRLTSLTPDAALIETDQELTNYKKMVPGITPTAPGLLKTHMSYVAMKRNGEWRFVAAQNTAVLPASPK